MLGEDVKRSLQYWPPYERIWLWCGSQHETHSMRPDDNTHFSIFLKKTEWLLLEDASKDFGERTMLAKKLKIQFRIRQF